MKDLHGQQNGFIAMVVMLMLILFTAIAFAYLRVKNAR